MSCVTRIENTAPEIAAALRGLTEEYPFTETGKGKRLVFKKGGKLDVTISGDETTVTYTTTASALRGAGLVLAGIEIRAEANPFEMFGVMLDASRNGVMTVSYAKSVLRRLVLMGYNMVVSRHIIV